MDSQFSAKLSGSLFHITRLFKRNYCIYSVEIETGASLVATLLDILHFVRCVYMCILF